MKVLYIAPEFPNNSENAAQVRANQMLFRLAKKVNLHVIGFSYVGIEQGAVSDLHLSLLSPRKPGVLSIFSSKPRAFYRYMFADSLAMFDSLLRDFRPDIIHFDTIATFGLFEKVANTSLDYSPKIVLQPHDAMSRLYGSQVDAESYFLRRLYLQQQWKKIRHVEKYIYPKADICLVDSLDDAELLQSLSAETVAEVLPLGFDETLYCVDGTVAELVHPCIVFTGAMSGVQSIDAAVFLGREIMPLVWQKEPEMNVYLVGSSPGEEVMKLVSDKRIHVTGFVDDLAAYLRASDIYACPIRVGSGMRTRVVEALACGCAVVATDAVLQGLSVKDADEPWVRANTDSEFAEEIIELLSSNKREALSLRASEHVKSMFSWAGVADRLVTIYNRIGKGIE